MRRQHVITTLFLVGCGAGTTTTDDTDTDGLVPEDTFTVVDLNLVDQFGSVALISRGPTPDGAAGAFGLAAFVDDLRGIDNFAACVVGNTFPCLTAFPGVGERVVRDSFIDVQLSQGAFINAGASVEALGQAMARQGTNAPVYAGNLTGLSGPTNLVIEDGDLIDFSGSDLYTVVPALQVTAPSLTERLAVGSGDTVDLTWTAGSGDVYVQLTGGADPGIIWGADDTTGTFTFDVDEANFVPPFDTGFLVLVRLRTDEVDANGNTVFVQTRSEQLWFVDYENTEGWTELTTEASTIYEDCAAAAAGTPLAAGQYYGDLTELDDDHDLGAGNPTTNFSSGGDDGVIAVALTAGQTMTATYTQAPTDGVLYLLDGDCDASSPEAGVDATVGGEAEELTFTAPADGTWFLVLDGWVEQSPPTGRYSLVLEIE